MDFRISILGNHQSTKALIASLIADDLKPDLVVTLGQTALEKASIASVAVGLADWCRSQGINVFECDDYRLTSDSERAFFRENSFGIGVCTDWQRLLPEHVLSAHDAGVFGFHGSLMAFPNGRGRSPFNWSIRLGGESIFHNCFRYTEGADDGGVFNTTRIPIGPDDHIKSLQFKAMIDSRLTIRKLLRCYETGDILLTPQPVAASVWLPKLTPADSHLQFEASNLAEMLNIVRASSLPFAGAYGTTSAGQKVSIWRALAYDGPEDPNWAVAPVGAILISEMGNLLIKCRDGLMHALEVSGDTEGLQGQAFC